MLITELHDSPAVILIQKEAPQLFSQTFIVIGIKHQCLMPEDVANSRDVAPKTRDIAPESFKQDIGHTFLQGRQDEQIGSPEKTPEFCLFPPIL